MAYLQRRIERFLGDLRAGRAHLAPSVLQGVREDLEAVREKGGVIELDSVSPRLRSMARAYFLVHRLRETEDSPSSTDDTPLPDPTALNREFFALLQDVFIARTGLEPEKFVTAKRSFGEAVNRVGARMRTDKKYRQRIEREVPRKMGALAAFYERVRVSSLGTARQTAGMKLVLGGTQRFSASSERALRSMVLYSDTALIPDPVLPWLERPRPEERFGHVLLLQNVYHLLQLRPLADAELPHPAVLVFQSWEKSLEEDDAQTQDGIELLAMRFFSHYLDARFEDISEIVAFLRNKPQAFLEGVVKHALFVPFGGGDVRSLGDLSKALADQRAHLASERSHEYMGMINAASDAELVWLGIMDRLGAQFHLIDNAESLLASPLCALQVHWRYLTLIQNSTRNGLDSGISPQTNAIIRALAKPEYQWLGNVPLAALVELRRRGENEVFRRKLSAAVSALSDAAQSDLDRIAAEVGRAIKMLIAEHETDVRRIVDEYQQKHVFTAVSSWITLAAAFLPLFPETAVVVAGTAAAAKYAGEKASEFLKRKQSRHTLMGVMAAAAKTRKD